MYFTDLTNSALEYYHKKSIMDSFSVDFNTMMASTLFKMIPLGEGLYKAIPLFYHEGIRCNSDTVRILDDKAVLLYEYDDSYIDFLGTDIYYEDNSQRENLIKGWKSHGDDLNQGEFNNMVYLMRKNTVFYDSFEIQEGEVNGAYADYEFTVTDSTIVDTGFLLADTLNNSNSGGLRGTKAPTPKIVPFKVKLKNNYFKQSKYTLILTVKTIKNVNLDPDSKYNYIEDTVIKQELTPNQLIEVNFYGKIDFDDFNHIVSFSATVEITHDKALISMGDSDFWIESIVTAPQTPITVTAKLAQVSQEDTALNVLVNGVYVDDLIIPAMSRTGSVINDHFLTQKLLSVQLYNPATDRYSLPKEADQRSYITKYSVEYRKQEDTLLFRVKPRYEGRLNTNVLFDLSYDSDNIHETFKNKRVRGSAEYIHYGDNLNEVWFPVQWESASEEYVFTIECQGALTIKQSVLSKTVSIGDEDSGEFIITSD